MGVKALIVVVALASLSCASALKCMTNNGNDVSVLATNTSVSVECAPRHQCGALYFSVHHPGDNIRANGTSQKWTRPGMPPDSGGILRGYPLLGGVICPNVVSSVGPRDSQLCLTRVYSQGVRYKLVNFRANKTGFTKSVSPNGLRQS